MFEEDKTEETKPRCQDCEHRKRVYAQNNFTFWGCYHRPYTGKRVAEIKDCPKKENEQ
ncbi:MAG: hypothetical protein OSJ71_06490 [Acetatifactor sp.]|nr:hypothetical protein [Acetatifactor sp.]